VKRQKDLGPSAAAAAGGVAVVCGWILEDNECNLQISAEPFPCWAFLVGLKDPCSLAQGSKAR